MTYLELSHKFKPSPADPHGSIQHVGLDQLVPGPGARCLRRHLMGRYCSSCSIWAMPLIVTTDPKSSFTA